MDTLEDILEKTTLVLFALAIKQYNKAMAKQNQ